MSDGAGSAGEVTDPEFGSAGPDDVDEVVRLVQAAYRGETSRGGWTTEADLLEGQRVDPAMVLDVVTDPLARVLTAHLDGDLVACCELRHRRDEDVAYLGMFAVRPGLQDRGLGRLVLEEAERWVAAEWGVRRVEMTVLEVRTELLAWYDRRGYRPTGETGDFPYGDERFGVPTRPDLRFMVLAKDLAPTP